MSAKGIEENVLNYFQSLYTSEKISVPWKNLVVELTVSKIEQEEHSKIMELVTNIEVYEALQYIRP